MRGRGRHFRLVLCAGTFEPRAAVMCGQREVNHHIINNVWLSLVKTHQLYVYVQLCAQIHYWECMPNAWTKWEIKQNKKHNGEKLADDAIRRSLRMRTGFTNCITMVFIFNYNCHLSFPSSPYVFISHYYWWEKFWNIRHQIWKSKCELDNNKFWFEIEPRISLGQIP